MDRVVVQPIDKDKFRVYKGFKYLEVHVPKGYVTNGADIPRIFWSLFPPNSPEYLSAVVIHDYMCANVSEYGYEKADRYFYDAMMEIGVPKWKAKLFYVCCRIYHRLKEIMRKGK